ncbi:hypothetical protein HanXRQr2_Chr11g0503201 [Helianthus annuus]|uniref:Uncharacterized protein n=1 Tax=Helianthus annuus TaxID=4232 RepID=A0A9K3HQS9_HELAN|nr:hypothetical protein HanXRQr2_Chr11g0503201 [Helianthus annuus]KAJ0876131.1 hypothetical protein HanPSC8_Chr11g0484901 [Helianthus annuus]
MPRKHIIFRLLNNRPNKIQPISNRPRFRNLLSRPLTGAPIEGPTIVNNIVHCPYSFLNRSTNIRPMTINNIHILHIQPLQRSFCPLDNMFPGQAFVVGAGATPEYLSGDYYVGTFPSELSDCLAHDFFSSTVGVDFCVVEEVNAVVTAGLKEGFGFFDV